MWRSKRIETRHIWQCIALLAFILTPLISAILFCAMDGRRISDIYIPLGGWSDEIGYYKQVEGILAYGLPRGYFGYNQSRALYGSLGSWGIVLLIPYVLWGFFFGWNYCSPIYANIFFCMIGFLVFYLLLRPSVRQMGIFSLFWIVNPFLNRYVLSGVVEAAVIMELVITVVCGEYLLSEKIRSVPDKELSGEAFLGKSFLLKKIRKDTATMVCCTFSACLLTLARPYFAVFLLIPLWKALRDRQKVWVAALPLLAVGMEILFFLNSHYFCAPYFDSIIPFDEIRAAGISGLITGFFHGIVEIARLMWYAVRYPGIGVGWYYLLLAIEAAAMILYCVWRKWQHKRVPPMLLAVLAGEALILLSIIEMYDLGEGARHILSLIVVNAILLVAEMKSALSMGGLALICVLSVFRTQGADTPPYKDAAYAEYMDELKQEISEVVKVTDEISYDNVAAMPTADRDVQNPDSNVSTYYGLMYAMPAGMGISLDFQDYYDEPENIKAGYILVHPNGEIRIKLEELGMVCILEREELMLYGRGNREIF